MSIREMVQRQTGLEFCRFTVQGLQFLKRPDGTNYIQSRVADYSGEATLRWWINWKSLQVTYPESGCVVEGLVSYRRLDGRVWLDSNWVNTVGEEELFQGGPVFLPRTEVPEIAHPALESLIAIFNGIEDAPVRGFLGRVFTDPEISRRFVRCRASAKHHHRQSGGLLIHSVGVAERCLACSHDLERSMRDVLVAAALLHDIGKLETVGEGPKRPLLAPWVHHEAITLEILAPHLRWLDSEWPHGGALLRHCLTWYSTKPAGFAGFVGADILRAMDGIDVGMEMGKGSGNARFEPFRNTQKVSTWANN